MKNTINKILEQHKLKRTTIREEVLSVFLDNNFAISSKDIEFKIKSLDRITLYRTLRSFENARIIHKALDDGKITKYALCHSKCVEHQHKDEHLHFECEKCQKVYCLDVKVNHNLNLPKGFQLNHLSLLGKGICKDCSIL